MIAIAACSTTCNSQVRNGRSLSIVPEAIDRVEILYFPERILTRTALTPEMLERQYRYKIEIRDLGASPQRQQLLAALQGTVVVPSERPCDIRTAVLLYDKSGKRLLSLYFERGGKNGAVNDKFVSIDSTVYSWAKSIMRGFAD
jgi:hypothetical protein